MISCYKTTLDITQRIDSFEPGSWVSVVAPTPEERVWLQEELGVVGDFLSASLDDEETSHIDFDDDTHQVLVIVDCPFEEDPSESVDSTIRQFDTHPLALLFLPKQDCLVTVSLKPNETIQDITSGRVHGVNTAQRTRLLLLVLLNITRRYQRCLRSINRQFRENERKLRHTMSNADLMKMLGFEKSLVYFSTSLKALDNTLLHIKNGRILKLYDDDRDLLDDVTIEVRQAEEMCSISSSVINETMETFGSVINNNLNLTMRTLAIITLVLSMPTMVYSFYGMNTPLPMDGSWVGPFIISLILAVASACWVIKSKLFR